MLLVAVLSVGFLTGCGENGATNNANNSADTFSEADAAYRKEVRIAGVPDAFAIIKDRVAKLGTEPIENLAEKTILATKDMPDIAPISFNAGVIDTVGDTKEGFFITIDNQENESAIKEYLYRGFTQKERDFTEKVGFVHFSLEEDDNIIIDAVETYKIVAKKDWIPEKFREEYSDFETLYFGMNSSNKYGKVYLYVGKIKPPDELQNALKEATNDGAVIMDDSSGTVVRDNESAENDLEKEKPFDSFEFKFNDQLPVHPMIASENDGLYINGENSSVAPEDGTELEFKTEEPSYEFDSNDWILSRTEGNKVYFSYSNGNGSIGCGKVTDFYVQESDESILIGALSEKINTGEVCALNLNIGVGYIELGNPIGDRKVYHAPYIY